jgi:alpha-beta hydrolase superfamily lysophospholipase
MASEEARFHYTADDGMRIAAFRWSAPGVAPRAILQVAHGALEHSGRYRDRLGVLMCAGYLIYSADHRGHGLTVADGERGDFGPGGALACILDMAQLTRHARAEHPNLPIALLGHSMGAAFAQLYLRDHWQLIDGVVLSGTAAPAPSVPGGWNSIYETPRTAADWLSRDEAEVDRYMADPLCGGSLSWSAEASLMVLRRERETALASVKSMRRLPVYIFVGDADPVNRNMTLIVPLVQAYEDANCDVTLKVYDGGRHEMLNEVNRDEVLADLLRWLDSHVTNDSKFVQLRQRSKTGD